ncbi:OmpA family protein [Parahaliea maris]|uniref:OmpA family protein n=1 Tax=Parahaliea maris TaxID=2716870 RepID=A0A5C8ZP64_9GAMM|nr:OmpA family protein [Parahaliea maris]TXS89554.1 OmpA family protein [Parahaliea maris]
MPIILLVGLFMLVQALPNDPVTDRVILLPEADGSVGAVIVESDTGTREVNQAYQVASVRESGGISSERTSATAVATRYGDLLAGQPKPQTSYLLYFEPGTDELVPASQATLETLKADAASRPAPEIRVIGHTDTTASPQYNDELSLERAEFVIETLRAFGVRPVSYEATGRGERDLLVPTADGVPEPRNRRVEVSIR